MPDESNPLDIEVLGQRRIGGGGFPSSGPGGSGGDRWSVPDMSAEPLPAEGPEQSNPCANENTKIDWNADATAAEAGREFERRAAAQGETIDDREWGAYIYRNADGSTRLGPINTSELFGDEGAESVSMLEDGSPGDIVGSIHSHRPGGHLPSTRPAGVNSDMTHLTGMVTYSGRTSARLYIAATNQVSAGQTPYTQVNVYNQSTAQHATDTGTIGPEVNPNALPCLSN